MDQTPRVDPTMAVGGWESDTSMIHGRPSLSAGQRRLSGDDHKAYLQAVEGRLLPVSAVRFAFIQRGAWTGIFQLSRP